MIELISTSNDVQNSQTSTTGVNPTKRKRCPYGISCYRQNVIHRQQASHPGDSDWNDGDDDKNETKLKCPYGEKCYRKNPDHFKEYQHPKKQCIELKNKRRVTKRKSNILINEWTSMV